MEMTPDLKRSTNRLLAVACLPLLLMLPPSNLMAQLSEVPWKAIKQLEEAGNSVRYEKEGFVSKVTLSQFPRDFEMGQLAIFPRLESLDVRSRYYFEDEKMIGIRKLTKLKHFAMHNCRYADNGVLELLAEVPKLEKLEIERCDQISNLLVLQQLRNLKHLTISPDDSISFRPLIECRGLETLEIRSESFDDEALNDICRASSLKSISLNQTPISDEGLAALGKLPLLEKLKLKNCTEVTGMGFGDFLYPEKMKELLFENTPKLNDEGLSELRRFRNLEHLHIAGTKKVQEQGFACLANMKQLKKLVCPHSNITDEHLKLLEGIETLETIRLESCPKVSGRGLTHLSQSIHCKSLHLSGCRNFDSPDFEVLAKFKNLETLNLSDTRIRPDGIEQLAKLTKLTTLDIAGNVWLDDLAFEKLRQSTVSNLKASRLPRLTDACFESVSKMPNLKALEITANRNLSGDGIENLLDHDKLRTLILQKPEFLSLKAFSLIREIPQLEKLVLSDGQVTIAQIEQLSGMKRLTSFNYTLKNPEHNTERIISLMRSFPKL